MLVINVHRFRTRQPRPIAAAHSSKDPRAPIHRHIPSPPPITVSQLSEIASTGPIRASTHPLHDFHLNFLVSRSYAGDVIPTETSASLQKHSEHTTDTFPPSANTSHPLSTPRGPMYNTGPTYANYDGRYGSQPPYTRHRHHWLYIWVPLFTAFIWFGTLWALLITWLVSGRPHYVSMSPGQKIAYISDVAADFLKPLFIVCCAITGVGFTLSLVLERWLRHSGRLIPNLRRKERVMSVLAIFGAALGAVGLILLSIFDTKRHPSAHRAFLLVFILGVAISAIFTVAEVWLSFHPVNCTHISPDMISLRNRTLIQFRWLNKDFSYSIRRLRISYISKAVIAFILIALAVAFGILLESDSNTNGDQDKAAIIEWTISFGFTLYLLTFAYDLWGSRMKGELLGGPVVGMGGAGMAQPGTEMGQPMAQRGGVL